MWLIAFSWLAHQRPAPSPALISAGSWESGCWLPAGEAGRLSHSQQFMEVTRLASSSVFLSPEAALWINSSFFSQTKTWKTLLGSYSLLARFCFLHPFLAFSQISAFLGSISLRLTGVGQIGHKLHMIPFENGLSYRDLICVWENCFLKGLSLAAIKI